MANPLVQATFDILIKHGEFRSWSEPGPPQPRGPKKSWVPQAPPWEAQEAKAMGIAPAAPAPVIPRPNPYAIGSPGVVPSRNALIEAPKETAPAAISPSSTSVDGPIVKPGCTAADQSILVHGHLKGLADGLGGFGVLRDSKKRMERAATGAKMMGDEETSVKLAAIAEELPAVRDEAAAARVAAELEPLLPLTWALGKRCGGTGITPELESKIRDLAERVKSGLLSREEAVKQIRESAGEK